MRQVSTNLHIAWCCADKLISIAQFLNNDAPGAEIEDFQNAEINLNERPALSLLDSVPARFAQPEYVFSDLEPVKPALATLRSADASLLWALVMLLVNWLQHFYHLSNHAGSMCLWGLFLILNSECPDAFPSSYTPVVTLSSANRRFGLQDRFLVIPMCLQCRKIVSLEDDAGTDALCPYCSERLYSDNPDKPKLKLKLPFNPISVQLTELLTRDGMEELIESWRTWVRTPGILEDIMDGAVWKSLKAHDGSLFFDNHPNRLNSTELRIGITVCIDGYVSLIFAH